METRPDIHRFVLFGQWIPTIVLRMTIDAPDRLLLLLVHSRVVAKSQ